MNHLSAAPAGAHSTLVVDDDPDMCWVLQTTLAVFGHAATIAQSAHEALSLTARQVFQVAFIDARLPDMHGLHLAARMAAQHREMKIIIISGFYSDDDPEIADAIRSRRVHSFLAKPFQIDAIKGAVAASGPKLDRRFCRWSVLASPGVVA